MSRRITNNSTIVMPNPFLGAPHLQIKPMHNNDTQQIVKNKKKRNPLKGIKAGDDGTHIVVILDESGSMSGAQKSTIDGYNEFMNGQRVDMEKGDDSWVTTVKFEGGNIVTLTSGLDINELPDLNNQTYVPRGGTNLLDAIGSTIEDVDQSLKAKKKKNRPSVLFVIFTDGHENCSCKYDNEMLKAMIKNREDKCDWAFTFLGANVDAFGMGHMFGMSAANTMQYSTNNMAETFSAGSASTTRFRDMKKAGLSTAEVYTRGMYTDDERDSADE